MIWKALIMLSTIFFVQAASTVPKVLKNTNAFVMPQSGCAASSPGTCVDPSGCKIGYSLSGAFSTAFQERPSDSTCYDACYYQVFSCTKECKHLSEILDTAGSNQGCLCKILQPDRDLKLACEEECFSMSRRCIPNCMKIQQQCPFGRLATWFSFSRAVTGSCYANDCT